MPGMAEKEFDADPKRTLRMFLYSLSGSIPKEHKESVTRRAAGRLRTKGLGQSEIWKWPATFR
jgi:hypothetical protein